MQARMKQHQLSETEISALLSKAQVGHIGTINSEGYPYVLPVHFVYYKGKIYIHGLIQGTKIENLIANPKVGFEVDIMEGLILDDKACDVNTKYQSVVIMGQAKMVHLVDKKIEILNQVVAKYTPQLAGQQYPENMLKGTGIIEITIDSITGKFYK